MTRRLSSLILIALMILVPLAAGCGGDDQETGGDAPPATAPAQNPPPATGPAAQPAPLEMARADMRKAADWLLAQQLDNGAWPGEHGDQLFPDVGITGIALTALLESPLGYDESDEAIQRGLAFLLGNVQADGGIYEAGQEGHASYKTSIAIMALVAANPNTYGDQIINAVNYLRTLQRTGEGIDAGGIGYGSSGLSNLSTTQWAIDALAASGRVDPNDPIWQGLVGFLSNCQARPESNRTLQILTAKGEAPSFFIPNDGGAHYAPNETKVATDDPANQTPDGTPILGSYGSMTYAFLKSMIYAHVERDDPRIQAAMRWIQAHYTLDENPGLSTRAEPTLGQQGLFYYYHTMAKALAAWGETELVTEDMEAHNWAAEIIARLHELQSPEGFWLNPVTRWQEDWEVLVTSYGLLALGYCHDQLAGEN